MKTNRFIICWTLGAMLWVTLLAMLASAQSLDQPPDGIRPGLLRERAGMAQAIPPIEAAPGFAKITIAEWPKWISAKNNTSWWAYYVQDQDGVGSCAAESCAGGLMIARERQGLPRVVLNPWFLYHTTSGGVDGGSTLADNLQMIMTQGCAPESIWPRSKGWRTEPSAEAKTAALKYRIKAYYRVTDWEGFGSALLQGYAVYWGYSGHAIVGVDLLSTDSFRYLNSWGRWGSGSPYNSLGYGFGSVNKSSIMWAYGVYAFLEAEHEEGPRVELSREAARWLGTRNQLPIEYATAP